MNMRSIEFTAEEKALLAKIDFDPASESMTPPTGEGRRGFAAANEIIDCAQGNPRDQDKIFHRSRFQHRGRGRSRADRFEKNGTGASDLSTCAFSQISSLLSYGPELPDNVLAAFRDRIADGSSPHPISFRLASSHGN